MGETPRAGPQTNLNGLVISVSSLLSFEFTSYQATNICHPSQLIWLFTYQNYLSQVSRLEFRLFLTFDIKSALTEMQENY